jgi:hypothetical protein
MLLGPAVAPVGADVRSSRWGRLLASARRSKPVDTTLPELRRTLSACLADLPSSEVEALRRLIAHTRTSAELWHLRPEVFRRLALHHSQSEATRRMVAVDAQFGAHGYVSAPQRPLRPLLHP